MSKDLTSEVEKRLRETEAQLRAVLESVSECFYALDSEWRFTVFNRASEEYFGVTRDQILGQNLWEVFAQGLGTEYETRCRDAMDHGIACSFEAASLYKPGRYGDLRIVPMDGGGIAVSIADITERRIAQDTLEERVRETTAERDRIWNNARDLLVIVDAGGSLIAANPAWTTTLGYLPDELIGRNYLTLIHPDDQTASQEAFAIASKETLLPFESRLLHKDGSYRSIAFVSVPEDDFIYGSGRDVTDDKAHQIQLDSARAQLNEMQKMDTIGQLSGGIAHDFNNLLTPIVGSLDMLHRKYGEDERTVRMLSGALQAAERARVLVSRLLTFARRQHLEAQPVAVAALANSMVDLIQRTIGPQIEVVIDVRDNIPPANVDPHQLELALLNMCVNARDAMPGGGKLTIANDCVDECDPDLPILPEGKFVRLCVIDTGHGMDAETLRRATEPFYSTKGVGKGTGLGLSMVHGLAVQSGGGLHITSAPGEGTTVTMWLPVTHDAAMEMEDSATFENILPSQAMSVLLVDDEELVLEANAEMLEALGHQVTRAASAAAALSQLRSYKKFDLLLTDYMMPSMTGLDLIAQAKRLRPSLTGALITGFSGPKSTNDGIARLTKPFRLAELARFVAETVPTTREDA